MRLFVGIEVDDAVRASAAAIARPADTVLAPYLAIRWVAAENLHLTLWFLGEVPEPRATAVLNGVGPFFDVSPFDLHIGGFGAFPPSGLPRVLWLGVQQGQHSLAELHRALVPRLQPLGFEPERRPFSAHLTLGRVKAARGVARPREVRALWRDLPADAGVCRIEWLTVFRSTLSSKGAVYEPLVRVPLR